MGRVASYETNYYYIVCSATPAFSNTATGRYSFPPLIVSFPSLGEPRHPKYRAEKTDPAGIQTRMPPRACRA